MTTIELTPLVRPTEPDADVAGWVCDNCTAGNVRARKRCEECGTSRD